jgi:small-conductance mechanosensitive channel
VWIGKRLSVAAGVRSQKIHISGIKLLDMGQVMLIPRRLSTLIAWVIGIALTDGWLGYVLSQFPYTRPWGERVGANLLDIVEQVGSAIVGAMPGLVFAIVIFVVARQIIRLAAVFFDRVETGKLDIGWIDADTVKPTRRICNFVIWVFALAMAYPYLPGAQTEAFKGLSLMLGLMVSLGSSSMIAQAFSGLILIYNRAFRRGDYVSIGASEGTVLELGMFMTRIQTGLGEEITLPNSSILAATIKNYSRAVPGAGNIVDTVVTIGYSVPWRQVQAMLEEAARRTQFLSRTPEPLVRQTALSDFYVEYRLIAHTAAGAAVIRAEVLNVLHGHIQDVFNEHGVQIMSPHYMMDTKEPQVVPRDQWYAAPAKPPEEPEGKS